MLQLELEDDYMEALQEVAKSHQESRRQFWADYLKKVCDSIPGLMETVRERRRMNYNVPEPKGMMGKPKEHVVTGDGVYKDPFQTVKGYRFRYLDEEKGFIDGYGMNPSEALINALGRDISTEEYYLTFLPVPDFVT